MESVKLLAEKADLTRQIAQERTLLQESLTREETERHAKIKALQEAVAKDEQLAKQQSTIAEITGFNVKLKEEREDQRKQIDTLKEQSARYQIGMENTDRDIKLYKDQFDRYERTVQKLSSEVTSAKEELTKALTKSNDESTKRAEAVQRAINADSERSRIQTEGALLMQQLSEKTSEISEYARHLSESASRELKLQREVQEIREERGRLVDEIRDMKQKLSRQPREIQISI
jgi:uncharacterized coiled-coil DUF342 family protein